jgi:hypothetical protein
MSPRRPMANRELQPAPGEWLSDATQGEDGHRNDNPQMPDYGGNEHDEGCDQEDDAQEAERGAEPSPVIEPDVYRADCQLETGEEQAGGRDQEGQRDLARLPAG